MGADMKRASDALSLRAQIKWLTGAAATAALLAAPALADEDPTVVEIDQVQLGDVLSNLEVEIPGRVQEAVATSTAVGNAAAGLVTQGDIDFDAVQTQDGVVIANSEIIGGSARQTIATTTAYGNSATGGTWSGNTYYRAEQDSDGEVEAETRIDMERTRTAASATTAIANVSVPTNEYGEGAAFQIQESNGTVFSATDVDIDRVRRSASFGTTAGGNAVSSTGSTSTNINGAVQTTADGASIVASTDVYIGQARDVLAATTAFGNSATVHNEWGYATLGREGSELFQGNDSDIDSQTYVTLDNWNGYATSSAYGVGNAATISNVGSDTGLYAIQNNYGTVYSSANFNGGTGNGDAIVTSTAIGNAATATLCNICGDAALHGQTQQYNNGSVIAQGSATIGQAGSVYGAATAVGNSATYQSNGH